MLYVAIWCVSIRPVVMMVREELHKNCSSNFTTHHDPTILIEVNTTC
jgi:hypothetical protein